MGCAESFYCQTQPCVEVRLGFWQYKKTLKILPPKILWMTFRTWITFMTSQTFRVDGWLFLLIWNIAITTKFDWSWVRVGLCKIDIVLWVSEIWYHDCHRCKDRCVVFTAALHTCACTWVWGTRIRCFIIITSYHFFVAYKNNQAQSQLGAELTLFKN